MVRIRVELRDKSGWPEKTRVGSRVNPFLLWVKKIGFKSSQVIKFWPVLPCLLILGLGHRLRAHESSPTLYSHKLATFVRPQWALTNATPTTCIAWSNNATQAQYHITLLIGGQTSFAFHNVACPLHNNQPTAQHVRPPYSPTQNMSTIRSIFFEKSPLRPFSLYQMDHSWITIKLS